jgi:hypothetical protein
VKRVSNSSIQKFNTMQNRKAKLALTVIAVLAIAGGAMAFKAHNTKSIFYARVADGPCTDPYAGFTLNPGGAGVQTQASIASNPDGCPLTTVTVDN